MAPWPTDAQVEQDLVLTRAIVELFGNPDVAQALAFRGGAFASRWNLILPEVLMHDAPTEG